MTSMWKLKSQARDESASMDATVEEPAVAAPSHVSSDAGELAVVDQQPGADVAAFPNNSSVKIMPNHQASPELHGHQTNANHAGQVTLESIQADSEVVPGKAPPAASGKSWMDDDSRLGRMVAQTISAQVQDWLDEHLMELAEVRIQEMLEAYFGGDA